MEQTFSEGREGDFFIFLDVSEQKTFNFKKLPIFVKLNNDCFHDILPLRIEDANFALFNYVTEMNNQVETLQDSIAKLKQDIKEARERGEEKERQQREKLEHMEKNLEESEHEADTAETKLQLMESVLGKLKVGTEDLYIKCQCGNTPVLSLLGITQEY